MPVDEADLIVALGGDGFLLHTLRDRLNLGEVCPVFGMNRGTVGFLMNEFRLDGLFERIARTKSFTVKPLEMKAVTDDGETIVHHAINEVSLLRETRETARIEVTLNGRRGDAGAGLRRRAGGDAGGLDRLQSLGGRADPAARIRDCWR